MERAYRERVRGPLSWDIKLRWRRNQPPTRSESRLLRHLRRLLPGETILSQWWLEECDYLVDFFVPEMRLVVEVDGDSHRGREGADRHRSSRIRESGYEVARATADHVMADARHIATQIAFRVFEERDRAAATPEPALTGVG